jgi:transcriptional regulator with XRE-family HTH domain
MATMKLSKDLAKKVLAINLQTWLKKKGLQQNEFAISIGMSPQQFSFYVTGKQQASEDNLQRMALGLGIMNPWELMRMAEGMAEKPITEAWNALIDLQALSPEEIIKARDYIRLLVESKKSEINSPKN